MVTEIRLYVEGGRLRRGEFRASFGVFLQSVRNEARHRNIRWSIITCGSRNDTYETFRAALTAHVDAFNVLLVDSEAHVSHQDPWDHLKAVDGWERIPDVSDQQCHLMVQAMEAWFLADREKLREYFGQGFRIASLPRRENVEDVPKNQLESSLSKAAQKTKKKTYNKMRDAPRILKRIRLDVVRKNASWCDRLVTSLLLQLS